MWGGTGADSFRIPEIGKPRHSVTSSPLKPIIMHRMVDLLGAQSDPIRCEQDLEVTIQALGWMPDKPGRYLPLEDDIASVAFWYQPEPHATFPTFLKLEELVIKPLQVEIPK